MASPVQAHSMVPPSHSELGNPQTQVHSVSAVPSWALWSGPGPCEVVSQSSSHCWDESPHTRNLGVWFILFIVCGGPSHGLLTLACRLKIG